MRLVPDGKRESVTLGGARMSQRYQKEIEDILRQAQALASEVGRPLASSVETEALLDLPPRD